ncbi:MAG: hypothetical protein M3163_03360 [Actinomycetota bacterium]|nr:hypothetical protein [Actinomycetota bacterium]
MTATPTVGPDRAIAADPAQLGRGMAVLRMQVLRSIAKAYLDESETGPDVDVHHTCGSCCRGQSGRAEPGAHP